MRDRDPTSVECVSYWDAELLSAGQFLYMYNCLNQVDIDDLNRRVGRSSNEFDQSAYVFRLLYEAGCTLSYISAESESDALAGLVGDFDSWLKYSKIKYPEMEDNPGYREVYEGWRPFGQSLHDLRVEYAAQTTFEHRQPTAADIDRLLDDDYGILVCVEPAPPCAVFGLVYGKSGQKYRAYHPIMGLVWLDGQDIIVNGVLRGWKAPVVGLKSK